MIGSIALASNTPAWMKNDQDSPKPETVWEARTPVFDGQAVPFCTEADLRLGYTPTPHDPKRCRKCQIAILGTVF